MRIVRVCPPVTVMRAEPRVLRLLWSRNRTLQRISARGHLARSATRPLSEASPNKTVEGLIGGMAGALVVTVILFGGIGIAPFYSFGDAFLIGLAAAVAAPIGDLCESLLKRDVGVKDMAATLPGHGGFLDRFDAMLFVLPFVFYVAVFFELGPFGG